MQQEGIFLVQISKSRANEDIIKTLTDIECPKTIPELLEKSPELVSRLGDRVQQIYYTCGRIVPGIGAKRKHLDQDCIMFDIDHVIQDKKDAYIELFLNEFSLDKNKTGIVDSGYGLQFIIQVEEKFFKKDFENCAEYFKKHKRLFDLKMQDSGLIGKFTVKKGSNVTTTETQLDTSVFRPISLARMPGTMNHAPDKNREMRKTHLLQGKVAPQAKTLLALMQKNLEDVEAEPEGLDTRTLKIDSQFVKENCGFIKWGLTHKDKVHEKDFFLMIGLLKALGKTEADGEASCLEYFREVQKVTESPTLQSRNERWALEKIIRARPASYKAIDTQSDESKTDPGRPFVAHPLQLRSPNFIATLETGFRFLTKDGKPGRVDQDGLLTHYLNECGHFVSEISDPTKTLYRFDETHYRDLHPAELQKFALDHVEPAPAKEERMEFLARVGLENMMDLNELFHKKTEGLINTASGVVDVRTGALVPHSEAFGFTYVLDTKYDARAQCPEFMTVMNAWMKGTEENIAILKMFGGYVLAGGSCKAQAILILTGGGQNGKSVFWKLLAKLMGWTKGGAFCSLKEQDLEKSHSLADLRTKLLCSIEEPDPYLKSAFWEAMKDYSAGGAITGAHKFKGNITFENRAKFILSMNQFSSGTAQTFGFLRRLKIVNFPHTIPETDRIAEFEDVLIAREGPGILNWFLEGYRELEALSFKFPTTTPMHASLEEYKTTTNMVYAFSKDLEIEEGNPSDAGFATGNSGLHYLGGLESGLLLDPLYERYAEFVMDQFPEGESRYKIESKPIFSRKLLQYFPKGHSKKLGDRSNRKRVLTGLRLNGQAD